MDGPEFVYFYVLIDLHTWMGLCVLQCVHWPTYMVGPEFAHPYVLIDLHTWMGLCLHIYMCLLICIHGGACVCISICVN